MAFSLPTNWEQDTAWILPDLVWKKGNFGSDRLFKHFPFSYIDANEVHYDQYVNMGGLLPTRALGTAPEIVKMPPLNVFKVKPGYYGLEALLEEEEMTIERQPNTINEVLDPEDRLGVIMMNCATIMVSRFQQTLGTFATSGVIENRNAAGQIVHREVVPNFQVLRPSGSGGTGPGWSANPATATPISDLIYWQNNVLQPGTSADFGQESALMCNPKTVNTLWNCAQIQKTLVSDYGATYKRGDVNGSAKLDGKNSINELMTGMGLPNIEVYREGFYPTQAGATAQDPAQFQYAIPDNTFAWIGKRPNGVPVGATKLTKHAGIGAYQEDRAPSITAPEESAMELTKGIYVIAKYENLMPTHYRIQMGVNMAPFIGYFRGLAGIVTG